MNNILKSLLTIGAVAAIAGSALTAAYYVTQINATNNTVQTGNLTMVINGQEGSQLGPALFATNMYPGTFAQSAAQIHNSGTIRLNPSISLSGAVDPNRLAGKLWLQIWTNGKLWFSNWITNAPGYTSGKVTLDSINPGADMYVAFRIILDESATVAGPYNVNVVVTGYQWNDPAGATTAPVSVDSATYKAPTWSYNVCGTRPSSPYYSYDQNVWYVHSAYAPTGTNADFSCTVPF